MMRPARIKSAFTRWAVLTSPGSLKSTVTPPRPICATRRATRTRLRRRGARAVVRRQVRTTVTSSSRVKGMALSRWLNSIRTWVSAGGSRRPWHRGQSGQPRPEPVALTILPMVMRRKRATMAAHVQARGGQPRGGLSAMRGSRRRHRDVVAARGLPAEEDHADGDQEDETAWNPHDEAAQVLVDVRRERLPYTRRRLVDRKSTR